MEHANGTIICKETAKECLSALRSFQVAKISVFSCSKCICFCPTFDEFYFGILLNNLQRWHFRWSVKHVHSHMCAERVSAHCLGDDLLLNAYR